ncbi:hypothetical protein [Streptomyces sp. NPDC047097]|uniref:hypothetical protein n=1 Tax=Streptomyces sp. NPDC047097 TaxID=3155260 RepID=UPI0033F70782
MDKWQEPAWNGHAAEPYETYGDTSSDGTYQSAVQHGGLSATGAAGGYGYPGPDASYPFDHSVHQGTLPQQLDDFAYSGDRGGHQGGTAAYADHGHGQWADAPYGAADQTAVLPPVGGAGGQTTVLPSVGAAVEDEDPVEATTVLPPVGMAGDPISGGAGISVIPDPVDIPGADSDAAPDGPVFVDESGRRSKKFRRLGWVLAAACAVYAVTLVVSVIGGNSAAPWLLIPGPAAEKKAETSTVEPAPSGSTPVTEAVDAEPGATTSADPGGAANPSSSGSADVKGGTPADPRPGTSADAGTTTPGREGETTSERPDRPDTRPSDERPSGGGTGATKPSTGKPSVTEEPPTTEPTDEPTVTPPTEDPADPPVEESGGQQMAAEGTP